MGSCRCTAFSGERRLRTRTSPVDAGEFSGHRFPKTFVKCQMRLSDALHVRT